MSRLLAAILTGLAVLWGAASPQAQTVNNLIDVTVDSPWSTFSPDVQVTLAAQPLRADARSKSGLAAIGRQRVDLGNLTMQQPSITALFPGQSTTDMKVSGLRLYHSAKGKWWTIPEHPIDVVFWKEVFVPAGKQMKCIYTMPTSTALVADIATTLVADWLKLPLASRVSSTMGEVVCNLV